MAIFCRRHPSYPADDPLEYKQHEQENRDGIPIPCDADRSMRRSAKLSLDKIIIIKVVIRQIKTICRCVLFPRFPLDWLFVRLTRLVLRRTAWTVCAHANHLVTTGALIVHQPRLRKVLIPSAMPSAIAWRYQALRILLRSVALLTKPHSTRIAGMEALRMT